MLSDWCLGFLIKILLKSVIIRLSQTVLCVFSQTLSGNPISQTQDLFNSVVVIVSDVQTCSLTLIDHKLMQFIGMSSLKQKSSYYKGRIYNSNGKRHLFGWRKPVIVQKIHIASYATLQLYQGTVVSKLMNHEKAKNIGRKFHKQDKLPSKLLRLQSAKAIHQQWLNFRLP